MLHTFHTLWRSRYLVPHICFVCIRATASIPSISCLFSTHHGRGDASQYVIIPCAFLALVPRHLRRLRDSAHALAFEAIPSSEDITVAIMATLAANGMVDGAHARVTLTRGSKTTSSMNPEFNVFG